MRAQLRNDDERVVPEQPLGEELYPLRKVGNAYLSERGAAFKLSSEMVSSDSPLGEDRTSAQGPRHNSKHKGGPVPTLQASSRHGLSRKLSQIVVTNFMTIRDIL